MFGILTILRHTVLLTSTEYFFFKFLKTNKQIGNYVDLANDQALIKYYFIGTVSLEIMTPQIAIFGVTT